MIEKSDGKDGINATGNCSDEIGPNDGDRIQTFQRSSSIKELCDGVHKSREEYSIKSGNTFSGNRMRSSLSGSAISCLYQLLLLSIFSLLFFQPQSFQEFLAGLPTLNSIFTAPHLPPVLFVAQGSHDSEK